MPHYGGRPVKLATVALVAFLALVAWRLLRRPRVTAEIGPIEVVDWSADPSGATLPAWNGACRPPSRMAGGRCGGSHVPSFPIDYTPGL